MRENVPQALGGTTTMWNKGDSEKEKLGKGNPLRRLLYQCNGGRVPSPELRALRVPCSCPGKWGSETATKGRRRPAVSSGSCSIPGRRRRMEGKSLKETVSADPRPNIKQAQALVKGRKRGPGMEENTLMEFKDRWRSTKRKDR